MIILTGTERKEDKLDLLFKYKDGEEIGMYAALPWHGGLKVLVTTRMGYYTTTGEFKYIRKPDHMNMILVLVNILNTTERYRARIIDLECFPKNLSRKVSDTLLPFIDNKWIPGSFDLIHVKREIYADTTTNEFISASTGKRQSIFDGELLQTGSKVTVLEWLRAVDPKYIIEDGKLILISDVIKKMFGKSIDYKLLFRSIHVKNGHTINLTVNGTVNQKHKEMQWITS